MMLVGLAVIFVSLFSSGALAGSGGVVGSGDVVSVAEFPVLESHLERRARALMREIRCVACSNEPISQSASDISMDMRRAVRFLVADGATDDEVRAFFAERYGQFVLFRPARGGFGWLLWFFPFVLLAVGGGVLVFLRL